jgi:Ni/Fe-hydrogenase subunit HybB-like protein
MQEQKAATPSTAIKTTVRDIAMTITILITTIMAVRSGLNRIMIGAVVFGVMLSTLHQASLGAVFLISPAKMSPLWFTNFIPYMFLTSAIAMGLSMVSTEAMLSAKAFNHKIDKEIFFGLARGVQITLIIYLAFKVYFLVTNAGIEAAFDGSLEANMFLLEMVIGIILPIILLASKNIRTNLNGIFAVNILVIVGVLVNRMNVCLFLQKRKKWKQLRTNNTKLPQCGSFVLTGPFQLRYFRSVSNRRLLLPPDYKPRCFCNLNFQDCTP